MKNRLRDLLEKFYPEGRQNEHSVMEVMAGTGRKFPVWNRYFTSDEMNEQSPLMT